MSWKNVRLYRCCMCSDSYIQHRNPYYGRFVLPDAWTGSNRKDGECYCESCTMAILKMRDNLEGEQNV